MNAGTHVLALEGVADNCTVVGTQPRSITVVSGVTAAVVFVVKCDATDIEITTRTTGTDYPFGFDMRVDAEVRRFVSPNGTLLVTRLGAGSHTVLLSPGDNCTVDGDNPANVVVSNRAVTHVTVDVTCVRTDKRIAFVVDRGAGGGSAGWILMATANGSVVVALSVGHSPAWSPDGTRIAYSNAECDDYYYYYKPCSGGLVVVDPDTRSASVPENGSLGGDPSWSPDGKLIAFSRLSSHSLTFATLHLSALDGSPAVQLSTPLVRSRHPSWSPDGQRIVFECVVGLNEYEICVIKRNGTGFMRLTSDGATDLHPAWSPDGSTIAFTTNRFTGRSDVALMTPSGTGITRLAEGFDPAWSPDGSKLVFAVGDGLFTIGADGSNLTRITTGPHRAPTWRP